MSSSYIIAILFTFRKKKIYYCHFVYMSKMLVNLLDITLPLCLGRLKVLEAEHNPQQGLMHVMLMGHYRVAKNATEKEDSRS